MLAMIDRWVRATPSAIALRDERGAIEWSTLARRADDVAAAYRAADVAPGDRVAIAGDGTCETVVQILGAWRSGAVPAVLDPQASGADRAEMIGTSRQPSPALGPDAALVLFTSGSTGRPRGFVLSHETLRRNAVLIAEQLGIGPSDRVASFLPLSARMNLTAVLANLAAGSETVIERGLVGPDGSLGQGLLAGRVTGFSGVPTTLRLLASRGFLTTTVMPNLLWMRIGAGAVTVGDFEKLRAGHPRCALHLTYGMSEAGEIAWQRGEDLDASRPGLVGRPMLDTTVSVFAPDGPRCPPGEVGDIRIESPRLLDGYLDDGARRPADAAFPTGDLGALAADGTLVLAGRSKHVIKVAGESVSALAVERAILTVPGVEDAAVVPAPDKLLGEVPIAFIALAAGAAYTESLARAACAEALPPLAMPRRFVVLERLPRLPSGKVDRADLGRRAAPASSAARGAS